MSESNSSVKWSALWGIVAALVTFFSALIFTTIELHSNHPHKGVVHEREFERVLSRLDRIEARQDEILNRLPK